MDSHSIQPETLYRRRVERFAAAERRYASRERLAMNLRVATFLAAAVAFTIRWKSEHARPWYLGAGMALGGFVAAVEYHEHVRRQLQRNGLLRQINEQVIARLRRDWTALPQTLILEARLLAG
jgi:hypothetical protein